MYLGDFFCMLAHLLIKAQVLYMHSKDVHNIIFEVKCPISLDIFLEPILTNCGEGHAFEKEQFLLLFKTSRPDEVVLCPLCRKELTRNDFQLDNKKIEVINQLFEKHPELRKIQYKKDLNHHAVVQFHPLLQDIDGNFERIRQALEENPTMHYDLFSVIDHDEKTLIRRLMEMKNSHNFKAIISLADKNVLFDKLINMNCYENIYYMFASQDNVEKFLYLCRAIGKTPFDILEKENKQGITFFSRIIQTCEFDKVKKILNLVSFDAASKLIITKNSCGLNGLMFSAIYQEDLFSHLFSYCNKRKSFLLIKDDTGLSLLGYVFLYVHDNAICLKMINLFSKEEWQECLLDTQSGGLNLLHFAALRGSVLLNAIIEKTGKIPNKILTQKVSGRFALMILSENRQVSLQYKNINLLQFCFFVGGYFLSHYPSYLSSAGILLSQMQNNVDIEDCFTSKTKFAIFDSPYNITKIFNDMTLLATMSLRSQSLAEPNDKEEIKRFYKCVYRYFRDLDDKAQKNILESQCEILYEDEVYHIIPTFKFLFLQMDILSVKYLYNILKEDCFKKLLMDNIDFDLLKIIIDFNLEKLLAIIANHQMSLPEDYLKVPYQNQNIDLIKYYTQDIFKLDNPRLSSKMLFYIIKLYDKCGKDAVSVVSRSLYGPYNIFQCLCIKKQYNNLIALIDLLGDRLSSLIMKKYNFCNGLSLLLGNSDKYLQEEKDFLLLEKVVLNFIEICGDKGEEAILNASKNNESSLTLAKKYGFETIVTAMQNKIDDTDETRVHNKDLR